jgi:hypothetical protein
LGTIGLAIWAIVLLPTLGFFLLRLMGLSSIVVERGAPIWAVLFLATGIVLVSREVRALRIAAMVVGAIAVFYLLVIQFHT